MNELSAKQLSAYLGSVYSNASKLDKLKIVYRPYICPFGNLIMHCNDSKTILDIGCGSGQFLLLLSKYANSVKLGGIEISPALVRNAKELLTSQSRVESHIEMFDGQIVPDFVGEFDMVTLIDVFHHMKKGKREKFISDLFNKMKRGSKLIFKDINAAHPFVIMNKVHDQFFGGGPGREISVLRAKTMLTAVGFKILSVQKKTMLWYPHYTIICVKQDDAN